MTKTETTQYSEKFKRNYLLLKISFMFFAFIMVTIITVMNFETGDLRGTLAFASFVFAFYNLVFGWIYWGLLWKGTKFINLKQALLGWLVPVATGAGFYLLLSLL